MEIRYIDAAVMDDFVANSNKSHFMQTSAWGDVAESRNQIAHKLGIYDGEELKATALLLEKKIFYWSTFYCPRGFIANYNDYKLLSECIKLLRKYVKERHGLYLRIDPDLIWHKLNDDISIKEEYKENEKLISFFISQGAKWKGKTNSFKEMSNPRFTFRIPLQGDEKTILDRCRNKTRSILKNTSYPIKIYRGDENDLEAFYSVMSQTSKTKSIYLEPFDYYYNFYTILHKKDMSDIWLARVDIAELRDFYKNKIAEIEEKIKSLENLNNSTRNKNRRQEFINQLNHLKKEADILETIKEDEMILSSTITAKFNDKVWLVHGGNSSELRFMQMNYHLSYEIFKNGQKEHREYADFFGTEAKIDPKSPAYGIFMYKLGFGGDFDEFIGEFDFITRPFLNAIISTALKIRRRLLIMHSVKENKSGN